MARPRRAGAPSLAQVIREWGRIGVIGFGGPPAHIALLRDLCVARRRWLTDEDFEHGIAATNVLPGPASTQLAIYCAWRLRGLGGALAGGIAFIVPGLALIIPLAALFLASAPPDWVAGVGAGAGAVVAAVALRAGLDLVPASLGRTITRGRWLGYVIAGALATVFLGPWLVVVLLGAGVAELAMRRRTAIASLSIHVWPALPLAAAAGGGIAALCWTAFKVGALAFGGGFVIVPLMQADAVENYGWMTDGEFLNAVALGQATPGPVVQTVAAVGYAAHGIGGALLASVVAFAPSFWFIGLGARRFEGLRTNPAARAFLGGAGPAAIGAIIGSTVPLALALSETWQAGFLAAGAAFLLLGRARVVQVILLAAGGGALAAIAGAPLP